MNPSREDLLGYLLGALERTEHEQVENELANNPQLRQELAALARWVDGVGLTDEPQHEEPPTGLATRTCQFVTLRQDRDVRIMPPVGTGSLEVRSHFSLADFLVAAAVLVAAISLFFPAVASSRFQANVASCQNRLRQLGIAYGSYSEYQPDRSFPAVQLAENRNTAGVIAPILTDAKFVTDPRLFLCPSSQLAADTNGWKVPTLSELDRATGETLARYQENMGGDFGYNMGYLDGGELRPARNEYRTHYAIVADAPSDTEPDRRTTNHDGRGQNVLFEDGHIEFLKTLPGPKVSDDPFHNRNGIVAAGTDPNDAVLGNSADRPMPINWIGESLR